MNIAHYEPWSLAGLLRRDLDAMASRGRGDIESERTIADWVPAVDIVEEKTRFVLHADVPGVNPEEIDVHMDAGVLTVSGERKQETRTEEDGFRRIERARGSFLRRFTLPDTADAESITAKSNNGILEVSIPKLPEVQSRRIRVESA